MSIPSTAITVADSGSTTTTGAGGQSLITGTPTPGSFALINTYLAGSVDATLTGAAVATLQFEQSSDGGVTWVVSPAYPVNVDTSQTTAAAATSGVFRANVSGATQFRVRCTAYTSGTANVVLTTGRAPTVLTVSNPGAGGGGGGGAVTVADGANVAQGALADAAVVNPASSGSVVALLKGILTSALNLLPKGQATKANSTPVTLASDQGSLPVALQAATTGGATPATPIVTAATTNGTLLKTGAGTLYSVQSFNIDTVPYYLKVFDATAPTLGTTVPVKNILIPPNNGGDIVPVGGPNGMVFSTGLYIAVTSGIANADNTALATATKGIVNVDYK